ncbi:MAG: helicase HerA-like domain-containing protein [Chitinophagales bacterium]
MADQQKFTEELDASYNFPGTAITLGAGIIDGDCTTNHLVKIPLKTLNRHGLIAGATGTGKTKSLQLLAEGLSANGVPTLLMDIKGDLSGIAMAGTMNPKIDERLKKIGTNWTPSIFPVELLSLSSQEGVRLRATASEFGPVLLSKILDLNETQQGVLSMIFKYCDDKKLPLLDLEDLKKVIQYISDEGKSEIEKDYGAISTVSAGTILRKVIELEQQGAGNFFGEPSFDPHDLLRTDSNGKAFINVIRLTDIQDRPKLFSTFMLSLLAEVYSSFPEIGDADKPKLVLFIDEAHLIFNDASKQLLDQLETTIKLIRSKGVGVIFCTQNPQDIPAAILSQLGLKIQHALRAFTAADRKTIKTAAENFPESKYYKTDELLTQLGIGEALVTALNEKGIPTMLTATLMCSPASRMDILNDEEIKKLIQQSQLVRVYNQVLDRDSAFEILNRRMQDAREERNEDNGTKDEKKKTVKAEPGAFDKLLKSPVIRSVGVAVAGMVTRSLLGALGLKGKSRSTRK